MSKDLEEPLIQKEVGAKPKKDLPFVIGAGLGRTGTTSLHGALDQLGYKTLHMRDILMKKTNNPESLFNWGKAHRSKANNTHEMGIIAAKQLIADGYTATTDFPACLLYKELMELLPDAKVILSVRSSGEAWADSVLSTIGAVGPLQINKAPWKFDPFYKGYLDNVYPYLWEEIGVAPLGTIDCTKPLDRDALVKAYHDWNERVKATVPKDRLLIHESKDGFGPICRFLGIPENETPKEYPHMNDSESFKKMLKMFKVLPYIYWAKRIVPAFIAVGVIVGVIVAFL